MSKNNKDQVTIKTIQENQIEKTTKKRGSKLVKEAVRETETITVKYFDESRISSKNTVNVENRKVKGQVGNVNKKGIQIKENNRTEDKRIENKKIENRKVDDKNIESKRIDPSDVSTRGTRGRKLLDSECFTFDSRSSINAEQSSFTNRKSVNAEHSSFNGNRIDNAENYKSKPNYAGRDNDTIESRTTQIKQHIENLNINETNNIYIPPHLKNQNTSYSHFKTSYNRTEKSTSSWSRSSSVRVYEEDTYDEPLYEDMVYYSNERINDPKQFPEIKCNTDIKPLVSFEELKLPGNLYERLKSFTPTPIQSFAIPAILKNTDVICRAPTGVGKTIAFLVPLILKLKPRVRPCLRVLILTPTRELALQIEKELERLLSMKHNRGDGRNIIETTDLKGASLYGGTDMFRSKQKMSQGCDILIATPGRLCDFLDHRYVNLKNVKFFVLDEADRMLEMGFEREMEYIRRCLKDPLMYMFSATFDKKVRKIANTHLKSQICIEYEMETQKNIVQEFVLEQGSKSNILRQLIEINLKDRILIFVETKASCNALERFINQSYNCVSLHGDKIQQEREYALNKFSSGQCNILVATSVAARGLDIPLINLVINYDLPRDIKEYIHRIGRSGRCGEKGWSISIYNPTKNGDLRNDLIDVLRESENDIPHFLRR